MVGLARVYCESKRELIPSDVGARLANMLGLLIGSAKSQVMEQRLDDLEAKLAEAEALPPRANGYPGPAARMRS
jgi:hypothetical protein